MLADYPLQSSWLVVRKGKGWDGLLLHGAVVGFMSLLALARYLDDVWLPLLVLISLHTIQDFLKIYLGPRIKIHAFIPYMTDQVLHYLTIIGFQVWISGSLSPGPGATEVALMWTGMAVVVVTRAYDVTWWANWLDMMPYMKRWRVIIYAEHLAMLALAAAGLWFVAPLCALPRLVIAYREDRPLWNQRRGLLEMGIGIVLSVALGVLLRQAYAQI